MRFPILAAALLIAPLAACGSESAGDAADPRANEAVVPRPSAEAAVTETPATPARSKGVDDNTCGADKVGRWLNALPTGEVMLDIGRTVGQRPIRYYEQGSPITQDFSPARLNVEIGKDGRIKRFRCG